MLRFACSVGVVKNKVEQGASAHALRIGHNASLLGCVWSCL